MENREREREREREKEGRERRKIKETCKKSSFAVPLVKD